jgi:hypothetical protein
MGASSGEQGWDAASSGAREASRGAPAPLEAAALISTTLDEDEAAARVGGSGRPWGSVAPGSAAHRALAYVNESVRQGRHRRLPGVRAAGLQQQRGTACWSIAGTSPGALGAAAAAPASLTDCPTFFPADKMGGVGHRVRRAARGPQRVGCLGGCRRGGVLLPVQGERQDGRQRRSAAAAAAVVPKRAYRMASARKRMPQLCRGSLSTRRWPFCLTTCPTHAPPRLLPAPGLKAYHQRAAARQRAEKGPGYALLPQQQ